MKRAALYWLVPLFSVGLGAFIIVMSQQRHAHMLELEQRSLEQSILLVARVAEIRSADLAPRHASSSPAAAPSGSADPSLLLAGLATPEVVYVGLQRPEGMIAALGSATPLAPVRPDALPVLDAAVGRTEIRFRKVEHAGRRVLEGQHVLLLPDGRPAVLRVGVDLGPVEARRQKIAFRLRMATLITVLLILSALAVVAVLRAGDRRRRRAEAELAEQEAERQHWQMIGQMAATVAHEVRNPLNALGMAAQRLVLEFEVAADEQEEYRELLAVMESESNRVGQVVNDFLELGKPLTLERDSWPVAELLAEAMAPLTVRAEQEGKQLLLQASEVGHAQLDKPRMLQVLHNLIANALDAVDAGGVVQLSVKIDFSGLVVEVEDNGEGMDAATVDRVMQPFVTTKSRGIGLGLPLARRLIRAHGGELSLVSTPGQGTRAVVQLPVRRSAAREV